MATTTNRPGKYERAEEAKFRKAARIWLKSYETPNRLSPDEAAIKAGVNPVAFFAYYTEKGIGYPSNEREARQYLKKIA